MYVEDDCVSIHQHELAFSISTGMGFVEIKNRTYSTVACNALHGANDSVIKSSSNSCSVFRIKLYSKARGRLLYSGFLQHDSESS